MDPKQRVQSLFDELSGTYDSSGVDFFGQIARALVAHAELKEGSTVLDVGCGAGAVLAAASEVVGPAGRLTGIDLAEGMVERARETARGLRLENVQVQVGDAEAPPTAPRSVDAVLASLVLFFLPNIDLALDAYARTLVAGGTLAFSTFVGGDDWAALDDAIAPFLPASSDGQSQEWFESAAGIRSILSEHGFTDIRIGDVTHHVSFPSLALFHEWSLSTGWRATWRAIPPEARPAARATIDRQLDSLQRSRGALRMETAVRYTRAVSA